LVFARDERAKISQRLQERMMLLPLLQRMMMQTGSELGRDLNRNCLVSAFEGQHRGGHPKPQTLFGKELGFRQ
jgi:hypothetical protein